MCGIIGYSGQGDKSVKIILDGLEKLEYRGYDSAGVAFFEKDNLTVKKKQGRLNNLKEHLKASEFNSKVAIGHTRWATHGLPTDSNSHPHYSEKKDVMLVHNGIIENYSELKENLLKDGVSFSSETDSEVVAQLFSKLFDGDLLSTLNKVLSEIRGSYALAIMHKAFNDKIICCKNQSPLIIGLGKEENFIASDVSAILKHTNKVIFLEDGDKAILDANSVVIFDKNNLKTNRKIHLIDWDYEQATKNGYDHFMIKEIEEQSGIINKLLDIYLDSNTKKIKLEKNLSNFDFSNLDKIYLIACGTSYYAALQGQYFFKEILKIDVNVELASEFRYSKPNITDKTLAIFISQSGETFDTLMSLRYIKEFGAKTLAITNVLGSTITREADSTIYTFAGPEISVASTKAYSSQVFLLYLLVLYIANLNKQVSEEFYLKCLNSANNLPDNINNIYAIKDNIKEIAKKISSVKNGFYIGRGIDEKIAREGSLKMKEINYIHTEAIAAGELKHGSIALIEKNVLVVAMLTDIDMEEKMQSNIKEVKARGAHVILVTKEECSLKDSIDEIIKINDNFLLTPLLAVIPLQYLAYYTALAKGYDIDKPRNLAKSVTVE